MSHTTETLHVRGVRRARLLGAITERMSTLGFVRVAEPDRADVERHDASTRRLALRRDGKWLTFSDGGDEHDIDAWGEHLSRALGRSVLAIWTWDGEASVVATRWKNGTARTVLSLLREAYRKDDFAYAPAAVLRPWLPPAQRDAMIRAGIKLVTPSGGGTGDDELDALLEDFDDDDRLETKLVEDGHVFVSEDVSVAAIGATVGIARPFLNPWEPHDGDEELIFRLGGR
jgi:hypothetical protein